MTENCPNCGRELSCSCGGFKPCEECPKQFKKGKQAGRDEEQKKNGICSKCGFPKGMERAILFYNNNPLSIASYLSDKCDECGHIADGTSIKPIHDKIQRIYGERNEALEKIASLEKENEELIHNQRCGWGTGECKKKTLFHYCEDHGWAEEIEREKNKIKKENTLLKDALKEIVAAPEFQRGVAQLIAKNALCEVK